MKKLAVIIGGNRGIGLEFCRQLHGNYQVVATCRHASSSLQDLGIKIVEGIDVSCEDAYEKLPTNFEDGSIDLLICNAGIHRASSLENFEPPKIREQLEINSIAPIRAAIALLPKLKPGSKIALITSRMGSIADNDSGGSYGYRMSKAALNAAGKSLSIDLAEKSIAVGLLHPGWVRTDMTSHQGLIDPPESVSGMLKIIDQLNLNNSGSFWHTNGEQLHW